MGRAVPVRRLALLLALLCPAPAVAGETLDGLDVKIGRALFNRPWVPAPSSTRADDGLGPLYDARSCAACHPASGRAKASIEANGHVAGRGFVLVLGRPDGSGDPIYGRRLQIDAVPGLKPEGILAISETALPDGRIARAPQVREQAYGPLDPSTGLSLRIAPDLHGRGLMEQVSDETLLELEARQAREKAQGSGEVSGVARRLTLSDGRTVIGRYGWKAAQPTLAAQSSEAFFLDMGLSTPLHPEPWGDCMPAQAACRTAPHGAGGEGEVEIPEALVSRVVAYVATLEAPAPGRDATAAGARLFAATGCAACHAPTLPAKDGGTLALFSDLLLHDLGAGLADTNAEPGTAPSQWRTAPLAGLSAALSRDAGLLHDGRARTVAQAVRWHDGEAAPTRARFEALSQDERAALIAYVSAL